jgi:ribosome-associated heat shock protein Hsp15
MHAGDGIAIIIRHTLPLAGHAMPTTLRIDKWLWFARFFKTRSLAASVVEAGEVRLNGAVAAKTSALVRAGDELIFPTGKRMRRVTVLALGERRGPAPEAQALYREEEPPPPEDPFAPVDED